VEPGSAEVVAREERLARPVAIAAFAAVALYVISVILEQSSGLQTSGPDNVQLQSFHDHAGVLLLATIVRAIGFLLISAPLFHLFRAARARSPRVRQEMVGFAFLGPVLLSAQSVVAWIASQQIANDFLAKAGGGAHPAALAERLINDSSLRKVASALLIPAVLGLMVVLLYVCLHAMRTGLLTRFAGSLGMALGAAMFLIFPVALLMTMLWLLYVGALLLGWAPGGRPPAWAAGEAIPWPTPGEKAAASLAAGEEPAPGKLEEPGERRKRKQRS
jgi:hypothetical protein